MPARRVENLYTREPGGRSRDCIAGMLRFSPKSRRIKHLNWMGVGCASPRAEAAWRGKLSKNFTPDDADRSVTGFNILEKLFFSFWPGSCTVTGVYDPVWKRTVSIGFVPGLTRKET
jgi:hypothetical protein